MSAISVENLTFSYDSSHDVIFDNVSFRIDTDWRLGFIGRNGRGKTTFLNLLMGKFDYKGKISASVTFDYFPYPVQDKERMTWEILEEIAPESQQWEIIRELSMMDVAADVLYQPFNVLSGGEQTKVMMAALFLNPGHFLLIDEPTNHLDEEARQMVSAYLRRKKGFILVSHDRKFLDGCVDHILSLNRSTIEVQAGNFSTWFLNFSRQQNFEETENERLEKDIGRLRQSSARAGNWSDKVESSKYGTEMMDKGYIGHKSAKMMKRAKVIEDRREKEIAAKSALLKDKEKNEELSIHPLAYRSERLVSMRDLTVSYDGKTVCRPVTLEILRGERVALHGKNGCGKSSILKLILGENIDHSGTMTIASGLNISWVPQDTSFLEGSLHEFAMEEKIDESLFLTILRKMDFERIQFEKNMCDFSEGQKKKVLIARSLCQSAHLYIWDEPLNFIDVYSRMQIESLIQKYQPTMIFVEHDGAFRENVATRTVDILRE